MIYDPIADAEETAEVTRNVQRMISTSVEQPTPRTDSCIGTDKFGPA